MESVKRCGKLPRKLRLEKIIRGDTQAWREEQEEEVRRLDIFSILV
jgi:hypothetical protein